MTIQDDIREQYPIFDEDFTERPKNFFANQYIESDKMIATAELYQSQHNDIKQAIFELLTERWVDTAEGVNLDIIGKLVDQPRITDPWGSGQTLDDTKYRIFIKSKIIINHFRGYLITSISAMISILNTDRNPDIEPLITISVLTGSAISFIYSLVELKPAEIDLIKFKWTDRFGQERWLFETPLGVNRFFFHAKEGKYFGFGENDYGFKVGYLAVQIIKEEE